jgi:hypothetical protein
MATETTAQKTARLRALRYAVKGSPDEHRAAARALKEANERLRIARLNAFFGELRRQVNANPARVANNLEGVIKVLNKI